MKACRAAICEKLMEKAKTNPDLCILVSDSRGSASLTPFAKAYPKRTIEAGIAEQNLVSMAAGMAAMGKRPFAASPASFLTMRSIEQVKVDVAYSHTNTKLIGISAGISYGALGMTHHSLQDIAVMSAIPGMRIYNPADAAEAAAMMDVLCEDNDPAYIRVGRNAVPDIHTDGFEFVSGKAALLHEGDDIAIAATGETVWHALQAAKALEEQGIGARVLDFHTIKPLDTQALVEAAKECKALITVEEHSVLNGFGALCAGAVCEEAPCLMKKIGFPDCVLESGESKDLYALYGLDAKGIEQEAHRLLEKKQCQTTSW